MSKTCPAYPYRLDLITIQEEEGSVDLRVNSCYHFKFEGDNLRYHNHPLRAAAEVEEVVVRILQGEAAAEPR